MADDITLTKLILSNLFFFFAQYVYQIFLEANIQNMQKAQKKKTLGRGAKKEKPSADGIQWRNGACFKCFKKYIYISSTDQKVRKETCQLPAHKFMHIFCTL